VRAGVAAAGHVRCPGEGEEVLALHVVEPQCTRERFENCLGGAGDVAALEARVVVDAHTRGERDLLSAQSGDAPHAAEDARTCLLGRDPRSAGGQEPMDLALRVHRTRVTPAGAR
jgi:hypothetical protein